MFDVKLETLADASSIVVAVASFSIACLVFWWQRRTLRMQGNIGLLQQMNQYNFAVLESDELLELEKARYAHANFTLDDVRQMFSFFIILNNLNSQFEALKYGGVSNDVYNEAIKNIKNLSEDGFKFITDYCLPRGYSKSFIRELNNKRKSEKEKVSSKTIFCRYGADL